MKKIAVAAVGAALIAGLLVGSVVSASAQEAPATTADPTPAQLESGPRGDRGFGDGVCEDRQHGRRGVGMVAEIAELLGLEVSELRAELVGGATIADLAAAAGVPLDDVVALLMSGAEERIATAVENGRITEDEAAERLATLEERITERVQSEVEFGQHRELREHFREHRDLREHRLGTAGIGHHLGNGENAFGA